ncbi:MAG: lasso RiPP family leader peptide-containing protein [Blastocatellia bacterium]
MLHKGHNVKQDERQNTYSFKATASIKKTYHSPTLVEYGNVAKVTQNMASGPIADNNGKLMMQ